MLSLRTTPIAPQPTYAAEVTASDQHRLDEFETIPWEGLRIRAAR